MLKLYHHEVPVGKTPGEVLFWMRRKRGITQRQLADKLGTTPQRLSRIERGNAEMISSEIVKVAKLFDVPSDYILLNYEVREDEN